MKHSTSSVPLSMRLRLVPANGELRIEIKGELAGILELCQEGAKKKPGGLSTAGLAEQIKMVAGEGNHRQLTLPPVAV
jgi:site-specific DNA recombinase